MNAAPGGLHSAFEVTGAEAGQKLLQFLVRRLGTSETMLHKWIRTGQVRINGRRSKPFARLESGDMVRIPPFALHDVHAGEESAALGPLFDVPLVFENSHLMLCNKPAGLPVHGGTGHTDSLAARLHACFAKADFMPTPAHRLDKATSGLIAIARSYAALRLMHEAFGAADKAAERHIRKVYLAWASGTVGGSDYQLMEDRLVKRKGPDGRERMYGDASGQGIFASMNVRHLRQAKGASLLEVELVTGRTHQIRAQLAMRGHPLVGDVKYGGPGCEQGLLLHASRLVFSEPMCQALALPGATFCCNPAWIGPWSALAGA